MAPRVAFFSLASDFGCQVQLTNMEDDLLDVLGLMDLGYWQLVASGAVPERYDIAVIEGAVTTDEHVALLRRVRETARTVIAIGACAATGGISALAGDADIERCFEAVYGAGAPVARGRRRPAGIASVLEVDYHVPGCPVDPTDFVRVLSRALMGLADRCSGDPLCAECKVRENVCLLDRGEECLGLVASGGCGARCVTLGRGCTACRGVASVANIGSARAVWAARGLDPARLDRCLDLYDVARRA